MNSLDVRTIKRLATLVCDLDGPFERRGYELQSLLEIAGWPDSVEYDGSPRQLWMQDVMMSRRHDMSALERLISRMCDELEYDDGAAAADVVRREVNRVLEAEGLLVSVTGRRPVLASLDNEHRQANYSAPDDLADRLKALIVDDRARGVLLERAREAQVCESGGAYTMALISMGSFVEGLLFALLVQRDPNVLTHGLYDKRTKRQARADRLSLALLIDSAHDMGLIQVDAKEFVHKVRDYRNLVHPREQLSLGLVPDEDTVYDVLGPDPRNAERPRDLGRADPVAASSTRPVFDDPIGADLARRASRPCSSAKPSGAVCRHLRRAKHVAATQTTEASNPGMPRLDAVTSVARVDTGGQGPRRLRD